MDYHSAKMLEYANDVSATGEKKNNGIRPNPIFSKWPERHSNRSYSNPDGWQGTNTLPPDLKVFAKQLHVLSKMWHCTKWTTTNCYLQPGRILLTWNQDWQWEFESMLLESTSQHFLELLGP